MRPDYITISADPELQPGNYVEGSPATYHRVAFADGHTMAICQTREQSYADLRGPTHLPQYRHAESLIQPGEHILDCACGTGYGTEWLQQHGATVTGVDISPQVIEYAQHRYPYPAIEFRRGDAQHIPLADDTCDGCCCIETIEHLEEPARCLAELGRVLRPGGWLIISTPLRGQGNPYHIHEYERAELAEALLGEFGVNCEWLGNTRRTLELKLRAPHPRSR